MLYSEFVEGTGCRENDHNYKVYKELELIYMNSDCTKAHIYEMGKKLVDNSKSEKELQFEAKINAEIDAHKEQIEVWKRTLEYDEDSFQYWKAQEDKEMASRYKRDIRFAKEQIKIHKTEIAKLKWVLA